MKNMSTMAEVISINNTDVSRKDCFLITSAWVEQAVRSKGMNYHRKLVSGGKSDVASNHKGRAISLDLSPIMQCECRVTISHWHDGISWQLDLNGTCESYGYLEKEVVPLDYILYQGECIQWYLEIPEEVRCKLIPFSTHKFAILYLVSHYKHARQLFLSSPTLFWLILTVAAEENVPENKLLSLMMKPRAEILHFCGLPPTKSALKLVNKLKLSNYDQDSLDVVRTINSIKNFSELNHLDQIGNIILSLVNEFPDLINSRLLNGICKIKSDDSIVMTINDIKRMANDIGIGDITERIRRCRNIDDLDLLHNRLVARLNALSIHEKKEVSYPTPPIKGTQFILPLTTGQLLHTEGVVQNHCVFSYHESIISGDYYVYKVIEPERATLGLWIFDDCPPELDQLFLENNQDVSSMTRKYVLEWLDREGSR